MSVRPISARTAISAAVLCLLGMPAYAQQMPPAPEEPLQMPAPEPVQNERGSRAEEGDAAARNERAERARNFQRQRQLQPQLQDAQARNPKMLEAVTVTAGRLSDMEERRTSTASKLVFGREELDRTGDSTLGEILKRMPGVTIGGRPGRGGDIRMRGLGNGYTQILVNGERPPGGFSLDTLSPDQVERIEIYRAPVAEFSTRAIAGTINVVLREDFQLKNTQLRIADAVEGGKHGPSISVTRPGTLGELNYTLTLNIHQNRQRSEVTREEVGRDASGAVILDQSEFDDSSRLGRAIQFTPRFNLRLNGGADTLNVQPFLMVSQSESAGNSRLSQLAGPPAPYVASHWDNDGDSRAGRLFGNWQHRFEDGARLTWRFGGGLGNSSSETTRRQFGADGGLRNLILDQNDVHDHNASSGVKYNVNAGVGHNVTLGAEGEWGWREQLRSSLDNGQPQFIESGENLKAQTHRLAAFAQDEWDITPAWGTSFGLRWEGIQTQSQRPSGTVENSTSVWSPVAHVVYRLPDSKRDQIRAAVTHSYRAPPLADLIAVPTISPLNSPTRPDRQGNPTLKPELSTGIDLAFEHYFTQSGLLSANLFRREVRNLIRRQTTLVGTRWVSQPLNISHAVTSGLELEAKFQLQEFFPAGPAIDVRSNFSRFWSDVEGIPGPNNRLDQQPTKTANFGLDYRLDKLPLTLGGNLNWTPGYLVQTSLTQTSSAGIKRQFDMFGLWKFSPTLQLRISANNLVNSNYLTAGRIVQGGVDQTVDVTARTYTTYTARLEIKI